MYDKDLFNNVVSNANINEMRDMLLILQKKLTAAVESTEDIVDKYVSLHEDYISDTATKELFEELYTPSTSTVCPTSPRVVWFGDEPYKYAGHKEHPANPIPPNSALENL